MELQQGQAGPLRSQQPEQVRRRRQQRPGLGSPPCGPGTLDYGRCVLGGGVLIAGSVIRVSPGLPARHRGTLSCKHHTETFSDSHAHGLFIWGLQLGTFSNLWLSAASFLAPSLRESALNPGPPRPLLGPVQVCPQLDARWHRKRDPLCSPPASVSPAGSSPTPRPARRRPLTRMALSCSVTRLCFLRPNRLPMAAPSAGRPSQSPPPCGHRTPPALRRPLAASRRRTRSSFLLRAHAPPGWILPASRTPCLALSANQMGSLINSVHLRRVSLNQASRPSETPNRRPHPAGP